MKPAGLDVKMVTERILLIEKYVGRLEQLKGLSLETFMMPDNFDIAAWNLRCALEATFDIAGHILSRIPGVSFDGYKDMALRLGDQGIVPKDFVAQSLQKMAGYRNRLTHFYFEVSPEEMYDVIQNHLSDFQTFLKHIKTVVGG